MWFITFKFNAQIKFFIFIFPYDRKLLGSIDHKLRLNLFQNKLFVFIISHFYFCHWVLQLIRFDYNVFGCIHLVVQLFVSSFLCLAMKLDNLKIIFFLWQLFTQLTWIKLFISLEWCSYFYWADVFILIVVQGIGLEALPIRCSNQVKSGFTHGISDYLLDTYVALSQNIHFWMVFSVNDLQSELILQHVNLWAIDLKSITMWILLGHLFHIFINGGCIFLPSTH